MDDFDAWNIVKKNIETDAVLTGLFPYEREVWLCYLGKNIGSEQNGGGGTFSRPVLVVKKFNNQIFWVVPLSTKQKEFDFYYNFTDSYGKDVSAVLAQLKLVSIKRFKRRLYKMTPHCFEEIRKQLRDFLV